MTYEDYVGLQLQIPRVRLKNSVDHAFGILATKTSFDMGNEWADAVAIDSSEIQEIMEIRAVNNLRAQMKASMGM